MGDVAKWVILVAAAVLLVGSMMAFPVFDFLDIGVYTEGILTVINIAGDALIFARGLINNLLSPWARGALSGLMIWLIGKWLITYSWKVLIWVYHYIFK